MKIAILDNYHDTLRTLACFEKLKGHDVVVWNDHVQDVETLAHRLRATFIALLGSVWRDGFSRPPSRDSTPCNRSGIALEAVRTRV